MELFRDRSHWKYGFSLTAHEVTVKFAAGSKEEASKWYIRMRRSCDVVMLHISRLYTVGKMLGRGHFAKINLAVCNESSAQCTVKSVIKTKLFDDSRTLVWP